MGVLPRLRHYPHHIKHVFHIHKLFLGRKRGGARPGDRAQGPGGRDWIVVGEKPKDFQDSREKSKKQSQRNSSSSKQRLHSLMFGDGSSSKSGSWNRSTVSGEKNQMYKQNFSIKMAGNRNLKQC